MAVIWESRFRILVGLDKLPEELTFLNSNADDDAILDSEIFWNHILSIIEMLGAEAARQQLQFAMSILSAQPHMTTPWAFMLKNIRFTQYENDLNYTHNLLLRMNQTVADILRHNSQAWSFRKPLVVILPAASRHEELKFVRGILENDPTNSPAWLYLLWFVGMHVKDFGIDTIDAELRDVADVVKCQDNMYVWRYRQWLVAEKYQNGGKVQSDMSVIWEEFDLTGQVLFHNVHNIYAWSHRKWIMERFDGWTVELLECKELKYDSRNALAWNQKAFIIKRWGHLVSPELRELELEFVREAIYMDRENEYPWMYLRCLYQDEPFVNQRVEFIYESLCCPTMRDTIDVFKNRRWCINALGTLLHLISLGYEPKEKACGVVFRLCSSIKLAANDIAESPCSCVVTDNKCETCRFCLILILQHLGLEAPLCMDIDDSRGLDISVKQTEMLHYVWI
ncbi:proteinfarnesyltransferase/ geranylgeranyltransferase type-1 subunit alpha [Striga asiatica]|uniref:Protein farnesyltransferase/geranylgeranyltransferase type-1 subunit alpha n=1 Tax=Striga asiatica TaxID=4170 RepID=A0A5A7QN65_STRAF|nr:proteinfarnesyltransferase/ geranylgeranyltransferase type-1 subunit alpha [Striga asiatica]